MRLSMSSVDAGNPEKVRHYSRVMIWEYALLLHPGVDSILTLLRVPNLPEKSAGKLRVTVSPGCSMKVGVNSRRIAVTLSARGVMKNKSRKDPIGATEPKYVGGSMGSGPF